MMIIWFKDDVSAGDIPARMHGIIQEHITVYYDIQIIHEYIIRYE